jgi:hypothetical protein
MPKRSEFSLLVFWLGNRLLHLYGRQHEYKLEEVLAILSEANAPFDQRLCAIAFYVEESVFEGYVSSKGALASYSDLKYKALVAVALNEESPVFARGLSWLELPDVDHSGYSDLILRS